MLHLFFILSLPISCLTYVDFLEDKTFHYVIVGAGTSGAVVASRLTEDPFTEVLLLEAGGKPLPESEIPFLSYKTLGSDMDWNFFAAPQTNCCSAFPKNIIPIHSGKTVGGTSSLNFMTYAKGNKMDYDNWKQDGWSYKQISSYFAKLEDYQIAHTKLEEPYHSKGGPLTITEPYIKSRAADLFLEAGYEIGHRLVDYNGKGQIGFSYPSMMMRDGTRLGTNGAYLKRTSHRPNLHLSLNSLVTKIHMDTNMTVYGLTYEKDSKLITVTAKREVIICAGAINSPKLLMLSGIGPRRTLHKLNIPVLVDLAGVGQNLQDHVSVIAQTFHLNQSVTLKPVTYETDKYLELWQNSRTGPMTNPMGFEGVAFLSTYRNDQHQWPDVQIKMNSANIWRIYTKYLKHFWKLASPSSFADTVTFLPTLLKPKSRGQITLKNSNPHAAPIIDPNYLSHPDDVETLAFAIQMSNRIANSQTFRRYGARLFNYGLFPQCIFQVLNTSEYYKCIAISMTIPGNNLAGTCKMGSQQDKMAVVDNRLRVFGVKNLRVVDASIMPTLVRADTAATCVMIGEKAADMIKHDWHLKNNDTEDDDQSFLCT